MWFFFFRVWRRGWFWFLLSVCCFPGVGGLTCGDVGGVRTFSCSSRLKTYTVTENPYIQSLFRFSIKFFFVSHRENRKTAATTTTTGGQTAVFDGRTPVESELQCGLPLQSARERRGRVSCLLLFIAISRENDTWTKHAGQDHGILLSLSSSQEA